MHLHGPDERPAEGSTFLVLQILLCFGMVFVCVLTCSLHETADRMAQAAQTIDRLQNEHEMLKVDLSPKHDQVL